MIQIRSLTLVCWFFDSTNFDSIGLRPALGQRFARYLERSLRTYDQNSLDRNESGLDMQTANNVAALFHVAGLAFAHLSIEQRMGHSFLVHQWVANRRPDHSNQLIIQS